VAPYQKWQRRFIGRTTDEESLAIRPVWPGPGRCDGGEMPSIDMKHMGFRPLVFSQHPLSPGVARVGSGLAGRPVARRHPSPFPTPDRPRAGGRRPQQRRFLRRRDQVNEGTAPQGNVR